MIKGIFKGLAIVAFVTIMFAGIMFAAIIVGTVVEVLFGAIV